MPANFGDVHEKYEIIMNVCRFLQTWDDHRRWLMDSKRFKVVFEVSPGVTKSPSWELCLAYDYDVRNSAMELVRMKGFSLVSALQAVRDDQEHRTYFWVQKLALSGNLSPAAASSSVQSRKGKGSAKGQQQSPDVRALSSKVDKPAEVLRKSLTERPAPLALQDRARSRTPKRNKKNSKGKGKGKGDKGKNADRSVLSFAVLRKKSAAKFLKLNDGTNVCWNYQDERCNGGCNRVHVCAGCGKNAPFARCRCVTF